MMPHGALLVNASRGGVVDEEALARALIDGQLEGAAVDVWGNEHPSADSLLLTPHIAGVAYEAAQALYTRAWDNVHSVLVSGEGFR